MGGVGALVERVALRPMLGKPPHATVLVTLALFLIIDQMVRAVWSQPAYVLSSPWDGNNSKIWGVFIQPRRPLGCPHSYYFAPGILGAF